jgi:molecular chaperone GrpE
MPGARGAHEPVRLIKKNEVSMSGSTEQSSPESGAPEVQPGPGAGGEARIAELEGQIADLTDRLLRSHAEMDNIRKRTEKEKSDTQKYAVTRFASDVLAIGDNLQRAMAAVPAEAAGSDPALKTLLDGVAMTEREFLNVLARHGVKPIDAKGGAFNPHLHQAVMEQHDAEVAAGSVLQVLQEGYTIEDRVLRPAMVVVAKGGFKPVPATPGEPAEVRKAAPAGSEATTAQPASQSAAEAAAKAAETAAKSNDGATGFGKRTTPPG